jgi:hypothetical protein
MFNIPTIKLKQITHPPHTALITDKLKKSGIILKIIND